MLPARANGLSRSAAPASSGEKPSGHGGGDAPPGDYAVRGGQKTGGPAEKAENPAAEPVWPEAWQVLLARTRPAPVVWTYAELGQDLTGNGDKERADCLRRIIASLQLPKGSSAFWPVCLAPFIGDAPFSAAPAREDSSRIASGAAFSGPDDFTNSDEVQFFHAGLQRLNPRVVIMLGALALSLSGLGISMRVPFTQQIHKGTLYVLLPGFSALLSKKALQERASVFLRSALSGLSLS